MGQLLERSLGRGDPRGGYRGRVVSCQYQCHGQVQHDSEQQAAVRVLAISVPEQELLGLRGAPGHRAGKSSGGFLQDGTAERYHGRGRQ